MKKFLLSAALLLSLSSAFAQTALPDFKAHPINSSKDATANDAYAMQAADYLLTNPADKAELDRLNASSYLFKWMEDTPDFTFAFDENIGMISSDTTLTGIYMACMAKYQLTNKIKQTNKEDSVKIWESFAKYVNEPVNNVKQKGKVKKLVEAYQQGKLQSFLK